MKSIVPDKITYLQITGMGRLIVVKR